MSDELPKGWCETAISEVAAVFLGKTPAKSHYVSTGKVKVVKFRDLQDGRVDFLNAKHGFVHEDIHTISGLRELRAGDVLITSAAHSGENIGKKCAYVPYLPEQFTRVFFTGELLNIRCPLETLGRWAYLFFRSADGFSEIQEAVTGVHLTGGRAKQMRVPLAPLAEQERILAKSEKLLGRVDACQKHLEKIPTLLKRFRQSVLATACSGRLTADWREKNRDVEPYSVAVEPGIAINEEAPTNWRVTRLAKLTALVTSGSRGWAKYYADSGSTFIRAQNINSDFLDLTDTAFVRPPPNTEGLRTKVQQNDILITITGANVTKSALVGRPVEDAYVSQHVALVRLKDVRLGKFLFQSIVSPAHGRKQLQAAAYGQGKPGLNLDNIRDVVVSLPPLVEQKEINLRVEKLFALADRIEERFAEGQKRVDSMTQAIFAKAFRGELVPTEFEIAKAEGRSFESAEELLERINGNG